MSLAADLPYFMRPPLDRAIITRPRRPVLCIAADVSADPRLGACFRRQRFGLCPHTRRALWGPGALFQRVCTCDELSLVFPWRSSVVCDELKGSEEWLVWHVQDIDPKRIECVAREVACRWGWGMSMGRHLFHRQCYAWVLLQLFQARLACFCWQHHLCG